MAAHFYCWEPSLLLNPLAPDFKGQVKVLELRYRSAAPSPQMLAFIEELTSRFPNPREAGEGNIWATSGRLQDLIVGSFVHFAVLWYYYEEAQSFIRFTASTHHLLCFDPQLREIYGPTLH